MTDDEIRAIALTNGFTLREQPDGRMDLNPYVYDFARVLVDDERESCAKICDARYMGDNSREDMEARRCAAAIRAG